MKRPKIICLTPVKNEAWILDNFIKCASLWADHIIIADQDSTDNTRKIAKKYSNVKLIINPYKGEYNEWEVRRVVIEEARKFEDPKVLISLDADEVLTPDFVNSEEWQKVIFSKPGTVIKSKFVNIRPDMQYYWDGPVEIVLGFSDDGSEYNADKIHTDRMIAPKKTPDFLLKDVKVMHFQYTGWDRMESKHRWYQCWERINNPKKSAIRIYRAYHHMYSVKKDELKRIPENWFSYYLKLGIDLNSVNKEKNYYWDKIVLDYIKRYGRNFFSKESIWDIDWVQKAKEYEYKDLDEFKDPRNIFQKLLHWYLKKTQYYQFFLFIRVIDRLLIKLFGW